MYLRDLFDNAEEQQKYLVELVSTNHDWYKVMVHHTGLRFLSKSVGNDEYMFHKMIRDKAFWAWWVNHQNMRDASFLQWYTECCQGVIEGREELMAAYNNHNMVCLKRSYMLESFTNLKDNIVKTSKSKSNGKTKNKKTK